MSGFDVYANPGALGRRLRGLFFKKMGFFTVFTQKIGYNVKLGHVNRVFSHQLPIHLGAPDAQYGCVYLFQRTGNT